MQSKKLVLLAAAFAALPGVAWANQIPPFGAASAYNLFAVGSSSLVGDVTTGADVGGRVAAAGTVMGGQFGSTIGSSIVNDPFGTGLTNAIVTAGGLTSGSTFFVNGGGNVSTPTTTGTIFFNDGGSRTVTNTPGIDFATLRSSLDSLTTQLAGMGQTGTIRAGQSSLGENPSWLVLQGGAGVNYFNLTAAQFASATLDIEVPTGATVIINVDGTSDTLGNAIFVNGVQTHGDSNLNEDILFNFADATSVDISNGLDASVLAPFALLTDNGGQIDGNFIAAQIDITGDGEVHNVEFTGTLPDPDPPASTPEPATLALMGTGLLGIAGALYRRVKA